MTRTILAFSLVATVALLSPSTQGSAAEQRGLHNVSSHEFSSRHRSARYTKSARLHYYDPYPWWWYPPHVKRARTNYLGWPHSYYPPDYNKPYFDGVAGYPGGFWLYGL
jgi:hypothetical protein